MGGAHDVDRNVVDCATVDVDVAVVKDRWQHARDRDRCAQPPPQFAVTVDREADALAFTTNVGDRVEAGPDHPLRVETDSVSGEPAPFLHVRGGLEARLSRPVFYELVAMAEPREMAGEVRLGVTSRGAWFALGAAES